MALKMADLIMFPNPRFINEINDLWTHSSGLVNKSS